MPSDSTYRREPAGTASVSAPYRRATNPRGVSRRRVPRRSRRVQRWLHRRRCVLRPLRFPRHVHSRARSRNDGPGTEASLLFACRVRRILPAAIVTLLVTAVVYAAIATPNDVQDAVGGFPRRFPVRRELVLHPAGNRLLRRGRQQQPGLALLVTRHRGTVLHRVAACARRAVCPRSPRPPLALVDGACRRHRARVGVRDRSPAYRVDGP